MNHDLRLKLPSSRRGRSIGNKLVPLGLACALSVGCDATVGDPQPSATEGATDGTTASGPEPTTSETTRSEPTGGTSATQSGTTPTEATTEPGSATSSEGSTGPADADTGSSTGSTAYPACLEPLLAPYDDMLGPGCSGFVIIEYEFQDQQVFVFDSSQCGFFDQFFPVYTEACDLLCNLFGFAGITECEGVEFYDNATEVASWPYPD